MRKKVEISQLGIQRVLSALSRQVSVLPPSAVLLFNTLYRNDELKSKSVVYEDSYLTNIKAILDSTDNPLTRAIQLVHMVDKIVEAVIKAKKEFEEFERSEASMKQFELWKASHLRTCLDGCLLLKEALDNNIFPMEKKMRKIPREERVDGEKKREELVKSKEQKAAERMVKFFLSWDLDELSNTKMPDFDPDKPVINVGLFQQLTGEIPVAPIADSILPFSLMDWQRDMFMALRGRQNVVVSAPTSSGKTMVALGYIVAFLQNEPKSLLVYLVPNNVLALEISAILNRYLDGQVSTILDREEDRRQDERVIVGTPSGMINTGFIEIDLPGDSLLVVDEVHSIANEGGSEMEKCLRRMSTVQTLILSATMTNQTIDRLIDCLNNSKATFRINERTQFIVQQDMVPRMDGELKLLPMNPLGALTVEELKDENLDLSMTPRDVLSLFVQVVKKFGMENVPEYLAPVRFFCLHNCEVPKEVKTLEDLDDEEETGIIRRLTMSDISKWQNAIISFMINPPGDYEGNWNGVIEKILDNFRVSLIDEATVECTPENAYKVAEELKRGDMFPALFFFPNLYNAVRYASHMVRYLSAKEVLLKEQKGEREKKSAVRALEKQISGLERAKGNGRELRARREKLERELDNQLHSEMMAAHPERCLSKNGGISPESFEEFVGMLKRWNKKFTQSHSLAQMVLHGIGVLSGDMPLELQVYIRQLFSVGVISLLMTTSDCAYGINTPTKTVILANGLGEANRRQMKGRAGRKGLGYRAFSVSFRCGVDEARQHLRDLVGETVILYENNEDYSEWISCININSWRYSVRRDEKFYEKTALMFGHGATLGQSVLELAIAGTIGDSNKAVKILLSLLPCIPYNNPYGEKDGWGFDFPVDVRNLYEANGIKEKPNILAYEWLMNQREKLSDNEKERFVESAKRWSYFIYLMREIFSAQDGKKLYESIQDLITNSIILTSTSLD